MPAIAEMINTAYQQPVETCSSKARDGPRRSARCTIDVHCAVRRGHHQCTHVPGHREPPRRDGGRQAPSAPSCSTACARAQETSHEHLRPVGSRRGFEVTGPDRPGRRRGRVRRRMASEFYPGPDRSPWPRWPTAHRTAGSVPPFSTASAEARVLATEARDLDELSNGRLVLGIGNGTKRMMSDWHGVPDTSAPALRMEELVMLLRRIWNLHEGPIHHEGRFYRMNSPRPATWVPSRADPDRHRRCPAPDVRGGRRVADGLAGHPLFTTTYVEEIVRPAIARVPPHPAATPVTWRSFP